MRCRMLLFFALLLIIPELGWGQSTVAPTSQTISSTSSTEKSAYPPMYILSQCGPEFLKIQETFTYKTNIKPTMFGSNISIVWGNGRFRMLGDLFIVQDEDHLPQKHHFDRQYGYGFEDTFVARQNPEFVPSNRVASEIERIRYVNGLVYTMGKDAYAVVNIQKEMWDAYATIEEAPSPHKEEFLKLKGYDKDNLVWTGKVKDPKFRWLPEVEPKKE
jgi:hypothetical protein